MLQQTQVATVVPYFLRFVAAFPTLRALAAADEIDVLRLWQGLGYYSRARNLLSAARKIDSEFAGEIPRTVEELQSLPGIGRYTAGAIASIAFDCKAPILDGNVALVLCRLEAIAGDPRNSKTLKRLWQIAAEILPRRRCGDFNSALMELGALICTPRQPKCDRCPVRRLCKAAEAGLQNQIPPPRERGPTPLARRWTICIRRSDRYLIERRPAQGRWGGLWQFPTIAANGAGPSSGIISRELGLKISGVVKLGEVRHALSHRRYVFTAFSATTKSDGHRPNQQWITLRELSDYPFSRPQIRIAEFLQRME
jgi:A/G-specific adenine glycosylase